MSRGYIGHCKHPFPTTQEVTLHTDISKWLIPKKDVLFIIGDWNAKVESQEIPGVKGKFGLGVIMKQGKG